MTMLNELLKKDMKQIKMKIKVTSISPCVVHTGIFKTGDSVFGRQIF